MRGDIGKKNLCYGDFFRQKSWMKKKKEEQSYSIFKDGGGSSRLLTRARWVRGRKKRVVGPRGRAAVSTRAIMEVVNKRSGGVVGDTS